MTQSEFETLIKSTIPTEDYLVVEEVYMYYPNVKDKKTVADLYKTFGMVIFKDMQSRAEQIMKLEQEIQTRKSMLINLQN